MPSLRSNLCEVAYRHIQQKLARQELQSGQKISEHRLARELGVSRTPVREAIHRLKGDGLLTQKETGSTFVAQPTRQQLVEMYEIRIAIESMLAEKAVRLIPPKSIAQLQQYVDEMRQAIHAFRETGAECMAIETQRDFLAADLAFHQLIASFGRNGLAYKVLNDAHLRHRAFGLTSHRRDLHHLSWIWLYHARIAAAVRRRDAKAVRRLLRRHIRFSMEEALLVFDAKESHPPPSCSPRPAQAKKARSEKSKPAKRNSGRSR